MIDVTIVYRQIHPSFVQAGFPTSQAFRPTPKDESKLSVYDGDQITAENAFQHYTNVLGLSSVGSVPLALWYADNPKDVKEFEKQMRRKVHYVIQPQHLWNRIATF